MEVTRTIRPAAGYGPSISSGAGVNRLIGSGSYSPPGGVQYIANSDCGDSETYSTRGPGAHHLPEALPRSVAWYRQAWNCGYQELAVETERKLALLPKA